MKTRLFKFALPIRKRLIPVLIITIGILSGINGCKDDSMGTLELTNKSIGTVQRIMIDGVNYGSLDPSESKDISLAPPDNTNFSKLVLVVEVAVVKPQ